VNKKGVVRSFRFSQQQIIGINYHYSLISDSRFDENNVRLLLIHLREFLRSSDKDNPGALGRANAKLLREIGDGVAHTVRDKGEWWRAITELVRRFTRRSTHNRWQGTSFVLYELDDIVEVFQKVLTDIAVLYVPGKVASVFSREAENLKICLLSMLHGQIFRVCYDGIADDFHFVDSDGISVRTELDLGHTGSRRELRLNARIPCDGGGTWLQCILRHELSEASKIDGSSYRRTGSAEGYCEPIKALRNKGRLIITRIQTGVPAIEVYKILRAVSYDTRPISKRIILTPVSKC
jgi:hypothetical protein